MASKNPNNSFILIPTKAFFILFAFALSFWLLIQIKEVVLLVFVSVMLALALTPFIDLLIKKKVSRGVSVLIIYLIILSFLGLVGFIVIPPVISQTVKFINSFPKIVESFSSIPFLSKVSTELSQFLATQLVGGGGGVFKATIGAFSGILSAFSLLVITAYLLLDMDNVRDSLLFFLPQKPKREVEKVLKEVEYKLGSWLRGEFILMCAVGAMTYIGLLILGVDYAAPLALIAGLLEIVPMLGPIIAAVPGAIVGFSVSPLMGAGTLAWYILVQQLENNFIVPKVMQKAIGFNPLITILALLIGGRLFGVLGALLSVPVTIIGFIVIRHILEYE